MTLRTSLICALATVLPTGLFGQANEKPAAFTIPPTHTNVPYGRDTRNVLDVWQAKSEKPTPLVVFIHGGGWAGGDKSSVTDNILKGLLDHGISVASVNYRLTPQNILPAPVHDAARAVQFLRSKAKEWNLDPKKFGAYGISAGACTTLWLATHDDLAKPKSSDPVERESTRLQAAVAISGQTSIEPEVAVEWVGPMVMNHGMIRRAVLIRNAEELKSKPQLAKLLVEFSPVNHVTADDPPMFLSYPSFGPLPAPDAGSAIHHANFGVKFKEKADAVGANCTLRIDDKADASTPLPDEFLVKALAP